jgi:hypothetical protein
MNLPVRILGGLMLVTMAAGPALAQGQTESLASKSSDASKAGDLPLDKVCLQRSNLYSAGAVVTMNEKPYVCKMDKNSGTGALSWVPMEQQGGA